MMLLTRMLYFCLGIVLTPLAVQFFPESLPPFDKTLDHTEVTGELAAVKSQARELAGAVNFLRRQIGVLDPTNMSYFPQAVPMDFANYTLPEAPLRIDAELSGDAVANAVGVLSEDVWRLSGEVEDYWQRTQERKKMFAERPFLRPAQGWLSSHFGWRRSPTTGRQAYHKGIDLAAMPGSQVFAPGAGRVSFAGTKRGYGKVVFIDHGQEVTTILAHLGRIKVRSGDYVKRGQTVGKVGTTGQSTGFHLHYEILIGGKQVNPWPFLEYKPEREGPLVCDPQEI